ncbi:MAG TPA: hypothetical protein VNG12_01975 [Acidimicrobiales bacterium]|nr:hypothetical protein [Acidimicrobiales bacterium]
MQSRTKPFSVNGDALNAHEEPPRRFAPGRVCGENACGTKLSVYNDGYFCSLHAPGEVPRMRGKKVFWPRRTKP